MTSVVGGFEYNLSNSELFLESNLQISLKFPGKFIF